MFLRISFSSLYTKPFKQGRSLIAAPPNTLYGRQIDDQKYLVLFENLGLIIWVRYAHGRCLQGHLAFNIHITRYAATSLTDGSCVRAQASRSMNTLAYHWIQKTNRLWPRPYPRSWCCRLPQPSFLLSTTASNIAAILNIILIGYSTAANQILIFTSYTISSYAPKLIRRISFCAILVFAPAVCFVTAEHVHANLRYCFTTKADLIGLVGHAPTARQLVLRAIDAGQNCLAGSGIAEVSTRDATFAALHAFTHGS